MTLNISLVAQSCPILCDTMDCSPTSSSVHGISQARILEWVAISLPVGSSQPRDQIDVYLWDVQVEKYYINLGSKPRADEQLPSWWLLFLAQAPAEPKLLLAKNMCIPGSHRTTNMPLHFREKWSIPLTCCCCGVWRDWTSQPGIFSPSLTIFQAEFDPDIQGSRCFTSNL